MADPHGILLLDKPTGPTSHDLVARVRRAFRQRAVGHAGTLDPMASGLLVVAVGEGTKLVQFLTHHDKVYDAEVSFGRSTDTLDGEGATVAEAPLPKEIADQIAALGRGDAVDGPLRRALEAERMRLAQVPPSFAAIKQSGRPAYERARRGEAVLLAPRAVAVRDLTVLQNGASNVLAVRLSVSKGYYVRSFARDLGAAIGLPSYLSRLRRLHSGPFSIRDAVEFPASDERWAAALLDIAEAARRVLPTATLTDEGLVFARHGKPLGATHFHGTVPDATSAWFDGQGRLVAVGRFEASRQALVVVRGFRYPTSSDVI